MPLLTILALASATPSIAAIAVPAAKTTTERIQLGFYHFRGNRVRVSFEKRIVVDKTIAAPPKGDRSGISDFEWVEISGCGTLTVTNGRLSKSQRLCAGAGTKSVKIDAGPPLTMTLLKSYQGID